MIISKIPPPACGGNVASNVCRDTSGRKCNRIDAIDALRSVVLLGILIVHCHDQFGIGFLEQSGGIGDYINTFVYLMLSNKCATAFNFLFGVSFYLMLRNPANSSAKFVWRCFLLMLIGLFNKLFYSSDALMWYGFWGMWLVFFRRLSARNVAICGILIFLFDYMVLGTLNLRQYLHFGALAPRYYAGDSIMEILAYPMIDALKTYLLAVANHPLKMLSVALLGYAVGKSGYVERARDFMKMRYLIPMWLCIGVFLYVRVVQDNDSLRGVEVLLSSLTYCYTFLFAWYRLGISRYLSCLCSYGRLGLTNYSTQSLIGVICFSASGFNLWACTAMEIYLWGLSLFCAQILFSTLWCRYFRYGPYEWVWRSLTECKPIPNRRRRVQPIVKAV